jgi:hypothetical protein
MSPEILSAPDLEILQKNLGNPDVIQLRARYPLVAMRFLNIPLDEAVLIQKIQNFIHQE